MGSKHATGKVHAHLRLPNATQNLNETLRKRRSLGGHIHRRTFERRGRPVLADVIGCLDYLLPLRPPVDSVLS